MSRKSREDIAISANNDEMAKLEDRLKVLRGVNEALEAIKASRKVIVRVPHDERGNV